MFTKGGRKELRKWRQRPEKKQEPREEQKIKQRWRDYFNNLLTVESEGDPLERLPPAEGPAQEISFEKVRDALNKMKNGKSSRVSGLTVDLLKHLGEQGIERMQTLLQKTWSKEEMPNEWEQNLESAYDRIPKDLGYWSLRKRNVPEKLIRMVKATYNEARTVVSTKCGKMDEFPVDVGLHQGSNLSPFLFVMVLDVTGEAFRGGLLWELLFADDLALRADNEDEL
ncbi:uncharacterized protein LOC125045714 [Penaeus chinensis]|uniref:uncharacterized protein LOC125045714 n=1 Tax=Penaeus chinensis TaxID=139456 RepID=UPI001FB826B5|nr:uncharacterized protein LOC125045714 [Penaeus chinensis]